MTACFQLPLAVSVFILAALCACPNKVHCSFLMSWQRREIHPCNAFDTERCRGMRSRFNINI